MIRQGFSNYRREDEKVPISSCLYTPIHELKIFLTGSVENKVKTD
jgi:hypothetical protein